MSPEMAELDAYNGVNERKWFITPESVERAIAEDVAKAAKNATASSVTGGTVRNERQKPSEGSAGANGEPAELRKELMDLRVANRGKDYFIEQLQREREKLIEKLVVGSHRIGALESELRQLSAPHGDLRVDRHG